MPFIRTKMASDGSSLLTEANFPNGVHEFCRKGGVPEPLLNPDRRNRFLERCVVATLFGAAALVMISCFAQHVLGGFPFKEPQRGLEYWAACSSESTDPILLSSGRVRLKPALIGQVCVLISGNGQVLGRSYDRNAWESSTNGKSPIECEKNSHCSVEVPEGVEFRLHSYGESETGSMVAAGRSLAKSKGYSHEAVSRFLVQATFGPTKEEIENFDYSYATWIRKQMKLPPTSHRQYFRERANVPAKLEQTFAGRPRTACEEGSRWVNFAFYGRDTSKEITFTTDGDISTLAVEGIARTQVNTAEWAEAFEISPLTICQVRDLPDGDVVLGDATCSTTVTVSNPPISLPLQSIPADRMMPMPEGAKLVEMFAPAQGARVLQLGQEMPPQRCNEPATGAYFALGDNDILYQHYPRLVLIDNTPEAPAEDYDLEKCPNAPKTIFNAENCIVGGRGCARTKYKSAMFTLDSEAILKFQESEGMIVYMVEGLRLDDVPSPCSTETSRWQRTGDTCTSTVSGETLAKFVARLETQTGSIRNIDNTLDEVCVASTGAYVQTKDGCFSHVHPDTGNVYDFSQWALSGSIGHPGNDVAFSKGKPNPITNPASKGQHSIVYPSHHPMARWEEQSPSFPLIGMINKEIDYKTLPASLQTEATAKQFGASVDTEEADLAELCGSPYEVANVPELGSRFSYAQNSQADVQFPPENDRDYKVSAARLPVWAGISTYAPDQLRQRVAFALSQIPVVTNAQVTGFNSETYLHYYDIFVRNAFGNYRDVLREVTYSPMMGRMLTYVNSRSVQRSLELTGKLVYPDENYAREIMQLFTIGLYHLEKDGTLQNSGLGFPLETYTNDNIMDFSRIMTGFRKQAARANIESQGANPQNEIDPMRLDATYRDRFPKMDLYNGYIGDGYPLCVDLPKQMFLRKGATYRYLGGIPTPQTIEAEAVIWLTNDNVVRVELDKKSQLYATLCQPLDGKCRYRSQVVLKKRLRCHGVECSVEVPGIVKVGKAYYEYVQPPCVEPSVFNDAIHTSMQLKKNTVCTHKKSAAASATCCSDGSFGLQDCAYHGERLSFEKASERCKSLDKSLCSWDVLHTPVCNSFGHFWTDRPCSIAIKVRFDGYVSVVHNITYGTVQSSVGPDNLNWFRVPWEKNHPTVENGCLGICEVYEDTCMCKVEVKESTVFRRLPSKTKALEKLHIGSVSPSVSGGYKAVRVGKRKKDVTLFAKRRGTAFSKDSIIGVLVRGKMQYFRNKLMMVHSSVDGSALFRNPVTFMKTVEGTVRDSTFEVEAFLDHLFYHKNTAPFISYRMIQRFVTSNPSKRYMKVVTKAFSLGKYKNIGSGKYGDLGATVAAVLLDKEARAMSLDYDPAHGQLREPVIKLIHFLRSMEVTTRDNRELDPFQLALLIGQEPHRAPNVFSFFRPEYAPAGVITAAGLVAPEAQIMTTPVVISYMNGLIAAARAGLGRCGTGLFYNHYQGISCYRARTDSEYARETSAANLDWAPIEGVANATAEQIVDELDILLTSGRLEETAREIIIEQYNIELAAHGPVSAMKLAQQLILGTPEFQITNRVQRKVGTRREAASVKLPKNSYKAIVYLYVGGGLDSYNVLVPHSNCGDKDMYAEYKEVRQDIALEKEDLLPIDVPEMNQVCDTFALHPELPIVKELYDDGDALFLANLGVLVEPVTKEEYLAETRLVPEGLFAHNIQTTSAQTINPLSRETVGVLGRAHDVLFDMDYSASSFSIAGKNKILEPEGLISPQPSYLSGGGLQAFNSDTRNADRERVSGAFFALSQDESQSLFGETWGGLFEDSLNQTSKLIEVLANNPVDRFSTAPAASISRQFEQVAKLIKGRNDLQNDRHAFYVSIGGLDTHSTNGPVVAAKLREINAALTDFVAEMKEQGVWDDVVIVQASEFARTITSNGAGTDHGWGGNYMMMGGGVKGQRIVGEYPDDLTATGSLNVGRGRFVPTLSWDSVWNSVLEWYGVPDESLDHAIPYRPNFYSDLLSKSDLFE